MTVAAETDAVVANPLRAAGLVDAAGLERARAHQASSGGSLSDAEALNILRRKLIEIEERINVFEAVYQMSQNTPSKVDQRTSFFALLTLELGYINSRSDAAWLRSAIERVETKNYNIKIGN